MTILKVTLVITVLAVALYFNGGKELLFVLTDANGGNAPFPSEMYNCPKADFDAFRAKVIETPRVEVDSVEDCLRFGESMNHPLICRLKAGTTPKETVMAAILSDKNEYAMTCHDDGDAHYITANHKVNSTLEKIVETPGPCAAGFIYGDDHQALLQSVMPTMAKRFSPETVVEDITKSNDNAILFGTSFASNFPENRISTGSHAANTISMAYQLVGTKKWILHHQDESTSLTYIYKAAWTSLPSCVETFLTSLKRPFVATTGPGDILYFPFSWQHMVYTEGGPSVMTNIRKIMMPSMKRMMSRLSFSSLVKVVGDRVLNYTPTGNPREGLLDGVTTYMTRVRRDTPDAEKENVKGFLTFFESL